MRDLKSTFFACSCFSLHRELFTHVIKVVIMSKCPHISSKTVGFLTSSDLDRLTSVLKCDVCQSAASSHNLWLCVHPECFMLGCSEGRDHSTSHNAANPGHVIQLNVDSNKLWCYDCQDEVIVAKSEQKFGALIRPPSELGQVQPGRGRGDPDRAFTPRGLVGLSNLGNTCYMNAALQCLLNTPALADFFLTCPALIHRAERNTAAKAFKKVVQEVWEKSDPYVAPSSLLYAVKTVYPMFRGFQQHDSQEFLRCLMAQLHEELMEPNLLEEEEEETVVELPSPVSSDMEEYETADSALSESRSDAAGDDDSVASRMKRRRRRRCSSEEEEEDAFEDASSSPPASSSSIRTNSTAVTATLLKKRRAKTYRSVISDIFDGKLVQSVQCLSCNRISMTTETFQDLSLPIPGQDILNRLRGGEEEANEGWMSWAWSWISSWYAGPNVTLADCLSYFFSADELKGDNMYHCEKCKFLRNGLKFSRVTVLPDSLCIHLKRFRHDFSFSTKVSTRVAFPLVDLDMAPWINREKCQSEVSTYDLTGVICHHGSAGGGHYTALALNHLDQEWYEFDDSVVTKVDPSAVMSASDAYVLFYRKNNAVTEPVRETFQNLLAANEPSLVQYYVSKQWLNRLEQFAEPGAVDNSDFLCPHGGVLPAKTAFVYELCVALPASAWDLLHNRYGGGPSCTRIYECQQCRAEMDALNRQKKFELEEFKTLHSEFQVRFSSSTVLQPINHLITQEQTPKVMYCLSSSWFKIWEAFVTNRGRDPPGAIDNMAIVTSKSPASSSSSPASSPAPPGGMTLRVTSDYLQISEDIWQLFRSIYGGGPQVAIFSNGAVNVTPTTALRAALPAPATRLRASSECMPSGKNLVTFANDDEEPE